jgi:hypothetical protein
MSVPTILKALPYDREPLYLPPDSQREARFFPHKSLITVSITPPGIYWTEFESTPPAFLALLDTGCNHNFSIRQEDLWTSASLFTDELPFILQPEEEINGVFTPFFDANLWIYRNKPGQRDEFLDVEPFRMELNGGIGVYKPGTVRSDRPPLLGLLTGILASRFPRLHSRGCAHVRVLQ